MKRRIQGAAKKELRERSKNSPVVKNLPLMHVTSVGMAREVLEAGKLETSDCDVFKRRLLYFFLAKPAYRLPRGREKTDQLSRFPFVFVFKPSALVQPHHVYPFDTGGATAGHFDDSADPNVFLEDYELSPDLNAASMHLTWGFPSIRAYLLSGNLREGLQKEVPHFEFATKSFMKIARLASKGHNRPDDRASAIEIAVDQNVSLENNVLLAILPKQFLEDPIGSNDLVIEQLSGFNINWRVYNWQPSTAPQDFVDEIYSMIDILLAEQGLL